VRSAAPDCVVHLAAEIGTQRNSHNINEVNVRGMRRLVDACEAAGVRRLVFASTVVTGDARGAMLTEDTPLPVETAVPPAGLVCAVVAVVAELRAGRELGPALLLEQAANVAAHTITTSRGVPKGFVIPGRVLTNRE
jgi:NAD dependent epimerase/dehydratase family